MATAAAAHFNLSSTTTTTFQCKTQKRIFTGSSLLCCSVSFQRLHPPPTLSASISVNLSPSSSVLPTLITATTSRNFRVLAVAEEEPLSMAAPAVTAEKGEEEDSGNTSNSRSSKALVKPCELYVCNLPRSYDMPQLVNLFKPYGTVQSLEISRNTETGISKGCGYLTMSSADEAIAATTALDGSDVDGREMRVKFREEMNSTKNIEIFNSVTNKALIFETPHKLYVGNLKWSIKSEFVREYFSQFGNVVSARVLYDRKSGKNRVYAFLSFSSDVELKAAMSSDGSELLGRKMVVRSALRSSETSSEKQ